MHNYRLENFRHWVRETQATRRRSREIERQSGHLGISGDGPSSEAGPIPDSRPNRESNGPTTHTSSNGIDGALLSLAAYISQPEEIHSDAEEGPNERKNTLRAIGSMPSMRRDQRGSVRSVRSTRGNLRHSLLGSSGSTADKGRPVPPVLTSSLDHGHDHGEETSRPPSRGVIRSSQSEESKLEVLRAALASSHSASGSEHFGRPNPETTSPITYIKRVPGLYTSSPSSNSPTRDVSVPPTRDLTSFQATPVRQSRSSSLKAAGIGKLGATDAVSEPGSVERQSSIPRRRQSPALEKRPSMDYPRKTKSTEARPAILVQRPTKDGKRPLIFQVPPSRSASLPISEDEPPHQALLSPTSFKNSSSERIGGNKRVGSGGKPPMRKAASSSAPTHRETASTPNLRQQKSYVERLREEGKFFSNAKSEESEGQQAKSPNAGQWVRQFLSRGNSRPVLQGSSTHLTALPSKRRQRSVGSTPKAESGPSNSADPPSPKTEPQPPIDYFAGLRHRIPSESFSKVILDLEGLLNEALLIARQAAEKHDAEDLSATLGKAESLKNDGKIAESNGAQGSLQVEISTPDLKKNQRPIEDWNFGVTDPADLSVHESLYSSDGESSNDLFTTNDAGISSSHRRWDPDNRIIDTSHITFLEPNMHEEHPGWFSSHGRDRTPYPPGSATQSRNVSISPLRANSKGAPMQSLGLPVAKYSDYLGSDVKYPKTRLPSVVYNNGSEADQKNVLVPGALDAEVMTALANHDSFGPEEVARAERIASLKSERRASADFPPIEIPMAPAPVQASSKDQIGLVTRDHRSPRSRLSREDVWYHIKLNNGPPIEPRTSSSQLRPVKSDTENTSAIIDESTGNPQVPAKRDELTVKRHNSVQEDRHFRSMASHGDLTKMAENRGKTSGLAKRAADENISLENAAVAVLQRQAVAARLESRENQPSSIEKFLKGKRHYSIRDSKAFSLYRMHRRQPIARDWGLMRKRFVAAVACISTALVGVTAGEVPAVQYQIVDMNHQVILGNVFFYVGLAIPTLCLWPLPLLHGRKPYTLLALALLLPLQFPQAIAVTIQRSPYEVIWRVALLLPRALSGFAMGFANMNFKLTLLDLFGSSLQSGNPHQELVNEFDARRHGGGMGVWLGIWSWCYLGSIGLGFLIGACIINDLNPSWGFWIIIILIAVILLLNVLTPEVRRSPFRRSVTEVRMGTNVSRRIARGEVMMHLFSTGPIWWWEECRAGLILSWRMIKQPGFAVLVLYHGWIYGQVVMIIVVRFLDFQMLLGALLSKYYAFTSPFVGLCVAAVPLGALLAVPFQLASFFSRFRHHGPRTDANTLQKRVTWTSHMARRTVFMLVLPFAGLAFTLASGGPPTNFMVPTMFAGAIGFLSNLAIAECNGIIMETFDTSDLQPGMTGQKPRGKLPEHIKRKRTNYSCFPRVSAAFAITQTIGFLLAAASTATGGAIERRIGAQAATGAVAFILLALTLMLIVVLWRWKQVQVIASQYPLPGQRAEPGWLPVIIGNPTSKNRRMNILELGSQSRWTEIRRRNRLIELDE
ncbi:MAG: hypothetical protein M1829_006293 [Trizodia sp. TS-e1964]|nr:MAG: hypothetical protein M1829_006293 [Trizodia sp. TS-e1964]